MLWFIIGCILGFVIVVSVELIAKHKRNKKLNKQSANDNEE